MISAAAYSNSLKSVLHLSDFNPLAELILFNANILVYSQPVPLFFPVFALSLLGLANTRAPFALLPRKALIASQRRGFNPSGMIQIPHEAYAQQSDSADRSVQVVQSDASDRCWCGCPEADSH